MKNKFEYPFDFTLFINDKIICRRCFMIRNYDKNHNLDLYLIREMIFESTQLIEELFKSESIDNLWDNYTCLNKNIQRNQSRIDTFKLTINHDSKLIVSRVFEGNKYPAKFRYSVDIRPIIPSIIYNIRMFLKK